MNNKLRAGQKIVVGETLVESRVYRTGDVFTVKEFMGKHRDKETGRMKRFKDYRKGRGIILTNHQLLLDCEIDWAATNKLNEGEAK